MDKLSKILKATEIICWIIAFLNATKWTFQILHTLFLADGTVNEHDALVRIYISVLCIIPALIVKGARAACKAD